jgi:hypothetical protein
MDLIRVRKKPSGGGPPPPVPACFFGKVSANDSIRSAMDNYYKTVQVTNYTSGEVRLKSIALAKNRVFKFHTSLPADIKVPAGKDYPIRIDFYPDSIGSYVDTLIIRTDMVEDSLRKGLFFGDGVGMQIVVDNSDSVSTYIHPQDIVPWDPLNIDARQKWQCITGSGYNGDRLLGHIYEIGPAAVEWYPTIPVLNGKAGDLVKFNVGIKIPPVSMNSSPCACYTVHETTGRVDTFFVNQNGIGFSSDSLVWLGNKQSFAFRRGGGDTHGAPAQFGFVTLENDTAAVSRYYADLGIKNVARDSNFYVRADAIVLDETQAVMAMGKSAGIVLPIAFELSQNYPNPFNPSTTISVSLPYSANLSVIIYDILGREIVRLIDGERKEAGYCSLRWDAKNKNGAMVTSGVYFYRLKADGFVLTKKMLLLR